MGQVSLVIYADRVAEADAALPNSVPLHLVLLRIDCRLWTLAWYEFTIIARGEFAVIATAHHVRDHHEEAVTGVSSG